MKVYFRKKQKILLDYIIYFEIKGEEKWDLLIALNNEQKQIKKQ